MSSVARATTNPSSPRRVLRCPVNARFVVLVGLTLVCVVGLTGAARAVAACPNESLRAEARSMLLAQCRAYEMVSPVDTADSGLLGGGGAFAGAAPDGEAAEFFSAGGFAGAGSNTGLNRYIARRENVGWATSWVGIPAALGAVTLFTTSSFDLTRQLVHVQYLTGEKAGTAGMLLCENLAAAPACSFAEVSEYAKNGEVEQQVDQSPDFSHLVFEGFEGLAHGLYLYEVVGAGGPAPVARVVTREPPDGEAVGGRLGDGVGGFGSTGKSLFHAISNDGEVIFFTDGYGVSYARVNGSKTLKLGGGLFLGASQDGSKVFLTGSGGKLYMDVIDREHGQEAVSETVPIAPAGQTNTYLRSSDDGSHMYFNSTGVLAANKNGNTPAEEAQQGKPNLYVYDTLSKETVFIAQTLLGSVPFRGETIPQAQVNGCPSAELKETVEPGCEGGRFFVFASTAKLTPDDSSPAQQVFEYDAKSGRLARVSTGEDGYDENGNGGVFGASIAAPYFEGGISTQAELFETAKRAVSDDGSTVVFSTSTPLSPRAVNDQQSGQGPLDVYESHEGRVSLISTGHSSSSDYQPTITPSGRDIFFTSTENILPRKSDGLNGLWDARIDGGFPRELVPPGGCNGDACQGPPSVPNLLAAPASATFSGLGNPAAPVPTPVVKPCRKGYIKKRAGCVKRKKKAGKAGHTGRAKR
jgi:hypothetical protein